ncbi:MAG: RNA polymerase-binding protein DksA [Gammaproteobacteria bacterium]|nr:MAG: RNA polymerase-binding protein DksA [Gammaproteobacteria bacterium]
MDYLSPQQLEELKELLLKRREEVLNRIRNFVEGDTFKVSNEVRDEIDTADLEMEREKLLRLRERETKYLHKIEYALRKIEEGTYGICENCGGPIGYERLKARPVAIYCINCKIKLEAEED